MTVLGGERRLRRAVLELGIDWDISLMETRVAGMTLLCRQLLTLREAGFRQVAIVSEAHLPEIKEMVQRCRGNGVEVLVTPELSVDCAEYLWQKANVLVDPRLLQQIVRDWSGRKLPKTIVCVDRSSENYEVVEKSPYHVGVPTKHEAKAVDSGPEPEASRSEREEWFPIGLELRVSEAPRLEIAVGRYYWHRIQKLSDRRAAKKKILLATMKPTDGVYARTNRRVSLAISHGLVETPVTPNAVTLITLLCSVSAAVFFAVGTYPSMVAGAFVSWFASMLDGVDGELARSKFLHSDFGCWLEMVCDYLYYVFVFTGIGVGLYRSTDNIVWLVMGVGSVIGVILGFSVIAAQRKKYSRANETSEFGLAFQKTVERQKGSVVYRFIRTVNFLATRAAMPYYIAFFTVLGLVKVLLVLIFVGTNLTWTLTGYASRLKLTLEDKPDRRQAV